MQSRPPLALWRLGFRPFFLGASVSAVLAVLVWTLVYAGLLSPVGSFDPMLWHAHEMIYGYTTAVIAGFVLTASQNWTGTPGVKGRKLLLLSLLWLSGRILLWVVPRPHWAVAIVDLAFYPALALAMVPYLKPADMKVERVFFAYFGLYFAGNLLMHLETLGVMQGYGLRGALLGLHTTILMIVFMGGRVIPFFTESELARSQPKVREPVEIAAHVSAWAFLLSQALMPISWISALVAFLAGAIHLARLSGWYVKRVRRVAILAVLYSSYFWIAAGFGLMGLVSLGSLPLGPAVHALTVGGLGLMTFGMMSRVALGHTGRKIRAHRWILAAYILLNLGCTVRVLGPLFVFARSREWILTSGSLWVLAFSIFTLFYAPMLLRPRVDGRPG